VCLCTAQVLGQGSFGKVRLAWHRLAGAKVAIKSYEKAKLKEPNHWRRVQQEIGYAATVVSHLVVVRARAGRAWGRPVVASHSPLSPRASPLAYEAFFLFGALPTAGAIDAVFGHRAHKCVCILLPCM
jgi:serine/threonine protein kinase